MAFNTIYAALATVSTHFAFAILLSFHAIPAFSSFVEIAILKFIFFATGFAHLALSLLSYFFFASFLMAFYTMNTALATVITKLTLTALISF